MGGVEEDDRDAEKANGALVFGCHGAVCMVGGDDEEGVGIPGHLAGCGEKLSQGVVGILYGATDRLVASFESRLVALRDVEGVVGGGGEDCGEEWLGDGVHGLGKIL